MTLVDDVLHSGAKEHSFNTNISNTWQRPIVRRKSSCKAKKLVHCIEIFGADKRILLKVKLQVWKMKSLYRFLNCFQNISYQREISDFEEVEGGQVWRYEAKEIYDCVVYRSAFVVQAEELQTLKKHRQLLH